MTIRGRIADLVDGGRRQREHQAFEETLSIIGDELKRRPFTKGAVLDQFAEVDSQTLDLWLRSQGWRMIRGPGGAGRDFFSTITEQMRADAVNDSRFMAWQDVTIRRVTSMWTDFGFGQHVKVAPINEELQEVFDEFWFARRNSPLLKQRKLHKLSDDVITDGEYFLVFTASTGKWVNDDQRPTIRRIRTEEISDIVWEEHDKDRPLYYRRPLKISTGDGQNISEIWYPDWQASPEQLREVEIPSGVMRADKLQTEGEGVPGTQVLTLQVSMNEINARGWPMAWAAFPWTESYKAFLEDRATIARKVAMFVDKITVDGNERAVERVAANLQTSLRAGDDVIDRNPPGARGSDWVQNKAVNRERMPLSTGAGDAQVDGIMQLGQVSAGTGAPLDWMGRPDAMQNRAVAEHAGLPWLEQMERYQEYWTDIFQDMVEIVAMLHGRAHGKEYKEEELEAQVSLESPLHLEPDALASQIDAITGAVGGGTMESETGERVVETLTRLSLNSLGIRDTDAVMEPPEEEAEEEETFKDLLEVWDTLDNQLRAMVELPIEGDPRTDGHDPQAMREAIDAQVMVLGHTNLATHEDLRPKMGLAISALMELRRRYE